MVPYLQPSGQTMQGKKIITNCKNQWTKILHADILVRSFSWINFDGSFHQLDEIVTFLGRLT